MRHECNRSALGICPPATTYNIERSCNCLSPSGVCSQVGCALSYGMLASKEIECSCVDEFTITACLDAGTHRMHLTRMRAYRYRLDTEAVRRSRPFLVRHNLRCRWVICRIFVPLGRAVESPRPAFFPCALLSRPLFVLCTLDLNTT
jgi:hypothetical protein